jgi:uncharacterized protein (DUF1684 family)
MDEPFEHALARFRAEKDRYFKTNPASPIEDEDFVGLSYYPFAAQFRVEADLEPFATRETVPLETSTGDTQPYHRFGRATFTVAGQTCSLTLYKPTFETENDAFFVPFRDATSGHETYGAGRYLEAPLLPDGRVLLDFNVAYHPFCAYSARYRCPLPPTENTLKVAVHAGEKL